MEFVSMLAALAFLCLFVIGSLVTEYFYELRYMHQQLMQKGFDLFSVKNIRRDSTRDTH